MLSAKAKPDDIHALPYAGLQLKLQVNTCGLHRPSQQQFDPFPRFLSCRSMQTASSTLLSQHADPRRKLSHLDSLQELTGAADIHHAANAQHLHSFEVAISVAEVHHASQRVARACKQKRPQSDAVCRVHLYIIGPAKGDDMQPSA